MLLHISITGRLRRLASPLVEISIIAKICTSIASRLHTHCLKLTEKKWFFLALRARK